MNYENWEQDNIERKRQRQKDDSMRIVVWCIILLGTAIMLTLFVQTCNDVVNHFYPPHK
jgi:hypothetical protein